MEDKLKLIARFLIWRNGEQLKDSTFVEIKTFLSENEDVEKDANGQTEKKLPVGNN